MSLSLFPVVQHMKDFMGGFGTTFPRELGLWWRHIPDFLSQLSHCQGWIPQSHQPGMDQSLQGSLPAGRENWSSALPTPSQMLKEMGKVLTESWNRGLVWVGK